MYMTTMYAHNHKTDSQSKSGSFFVDIEFGAVMNTAEGASKWSKKGAAPASAGRQKTKKPSTLKKKILQVQHCTSALKSLSLNVNV